MSPHRIRAYVLSVLRVIARIANAVVHITSLPHLRSHAKFFPYAVGKSALNELQHSFDAYAFSRCDQEMDMIRHYNELMYLKLLSLPIGEKSSEEKTREPFRLKQRAAAVRTCRYEIRI